MDLMKLAEDLGSSVWGLVKGLFYSDADPFKLRYGWIGLTRKGKSRTLKHSIKIDIWI